MTIWILKNSMISEDTHLSHRPIHITRDPLQFFKTIQDRIDGSILWQAKYFVWAIFSERVAGDWNMTVAAIQYFCNAQLEISNFQKP